MTKIITVVGATGMQGGSVVVQTLRKSKFYTVRAITRNRESDKAKALVAQGVEVVQADTNDLSSLQAAFSGSYAVFAATNFFEAWPGVSVDDGIEIEARQGINLAKAAAATATPQHYVWSTLPNSRRISANRIMVPHYESKNRVDDYIKADLALFQKTTFLWITSYAGNLNYPWYTPFSIPGANSGLLYSVWATPSWVPFKTIGDAAVNVGRFVQSILEQPEKTLSGQFVLAETDNMTTEDFMSTWAELQGKKSVLLQVDKQTYYSMWPQWGKAMDLSHQYWELMKEKSFTGEEGILTKEDLAVVGLTDTKAAFMKMQAIIGN